MSSLVPEGWSKLKLGNIGTFSTSSVDKKSKSDETPVSLLNYMDIYNNSVLSDSYPFQLVTAPERQVTSSSVRNGDVFFTPSSETPDDIGHSAVFKGYLKNLVHSYHTIRFSPSKNNHFDDNYKAFAFKGEETFEYLRKRATGSTRFTVSLPIFNELEVLCPPLQEQKKIASILTSVDEMIEKTQKQIDKLQDLKKATMNELLTKGIGHTEFKDGELGRIPKSWEVISVGEVAANVNDKFLPINNDSVIIKYIGLEHIQSETNMLITNGSSDDVVSTKTVFKEGDTLFGKLRPYLKKVVIATFSGICSTDILVIRATKIIIPQFLFRILSTDNTIRFTMEGAAGNIMPRTSWKELKEFRFGLPPLSEQQKIASMLSIIDKNIEEKQRKLSQTQSLKKSLMQDLLTGKVRVTVN
jgi:type I restriction enzyme S subunit